MHRQVNPVVAVVVILVVVLVAGAWLYKKATAGRPFDRGLVSTGASEESGRPVDRNGGGPQRGRPRGAGRQTAGVPGQAAP